MCIRDPDPRRASALRRPPDPLGLVGGGLLNCLPQEDPRKGRRMWAQGPGPFNRRMTGQETRNGGNQHVQQSRKPARLGATEQTAAKVGNSGEAGLANCTPSPEWEGGQPRALGRQPLWRPSNPRLERPVTPLSLPGTSPGASPGVSGQDSGCRDPNRHPRKPTSRGGDGSGGESRGDKAEAPGDPRV